MLVVAGMLYLYLLYPRRSFLADIEKFYFVNSAAILLLAGLGFASFIFILSERKKREILSSIVLVFLLALPILIKPSRAYTLGDIPSRMIGTDILLGPVITDLITGPIAGVFVLIGICSGCIAIAISLNDRYKITTKIAALFLATINQIMLNVPPIRFSNDPFLSVYILTGVFLIGLFLKDFSWGEGAILILPIIIYVCRPSNDFSLYRRNPFIFDRNWEINKSAENAIRYRSFALWIISGFEKHIPRLFFV